MPAQRVPVMPCDPPSQNCSGEQRPQGPEPPGNLAPSPPPAPSPQSDPLQNGSVTLQYPPGRAGVRPQAPLLPAPCGAEGADTWCPGQGGERQLGKGGCGRGSAEVAQPPSRRDPPPLPSTHRLWPPQVSPRQSGSRGFPPLQGSPPCLGVVSPETPPEAKWESRNMCVP